MKKIFTLLIISLVFPSLLLAEMEGAPVIRINKASSNSKALLGGGVAPYEAISPSRDLSLNQGAIVFAQSERPFGVMDLNLVVQVGYGHTTGKANYVYDYGDIQYRADGVGLTLDSFFTGLGIRYRPFEGSSIRPYIEGGGQAGYVQLTYDQTLQRPEFEELGYNYKMVEGVLDYGYYGEAGIDLFFQRSSGLRLGARMFRNTTRQLETLGKRQAQYAANIYFLGYFFQF